MSDCDSDGIVTIAVRHWMYNVLYGVSQKVENDYLAGLRCCDISDKCYCTARRAFTVGVHGWVAQEGAWSCCNAI